MKLCMFHPVDHPLKRGWVGRIDGEHVIQLAAQTLQTFFTGGGSAREHAVYPLAGIQLLAPVLHPPSIRLFENERRFEFGNPAAIRGPDQPAARAPSNSLLRGRLTAVPRLAGVVGQGEELGGYTLLAEWRRADREPPKDRDFALGLGPVVVTPDELHPAGLEAIVRVDGREELRAAVEGFDWAAARNLAADGTRLCAGDVIAGPPLASREIAPALILELEAAPIGTLAQVVES